MSGQNEMGDALNRALSVVHDNLGRGYHAILLIINTNPGADKNEGMVAGTTLPAQETIRALDFFKGRLENMPEADDKIPYGLKPESRWNGNRN